MKSILLFLVLSASAPVYGPYNATIIKVKDADTITLDVMVWPGLKQTIDLRLYGVDTPESRTKNLCEKAQGLAAKKFVENWLDKSQVVVISQIQLGKYAGRVVGNLYQNDINLSSVLMEKNMARPYYGGTKGKTPWPGCRE